MGGCLVGLGVSGCWSPGCTGMVTLKSLYVCVCVCVWVWEGRRPLPLSWSLGPRRSVSGVSSQGLRAFN